MERKAATRKYSNLFKTIFNFFRTVISWQYGSKDKGTFLPTFLNKVIKSSLKIKVKPNLENHRVVFFNVFEDPLFLFCFFATNFENIQYKLVKKEVKVLQTKIV